MRERPENFVLNYDHPLAKGLIFAGLSKVIYSIHYRNSAICGGNGLLRNMNALSDWIFIDELGRYGINHGIDKYVSANIFHNSMGSFSIWVGVSSTGGVYQGLLYGPTGGNVLRLSSNKYIYVLGGTMNFNAPLDQFFNLTCLWNQTQLWAYRNGTYGGIANISGNMFGDRRIGAGYAFDNGNILYYPFADPLVYNRHLSIYEIKQLSDPKNIMLSGLLQPPKRKYYGIRKVPLITRNALFTSRIFQSSIISESF